MHSLKSRLIYHILNSRDNYQNTSNIINPPLHVYDPLERQGPCEVFYKIKIKIKKILSGKENSLGTPFDKDYHEYIGLAILKLVVDL